MAYDDFLQSFFHAMAMPPSQPQSPFGTPQVPQASPPPAQPEVDGRLVAQADLDDMMRRLMQPRRVARIG